ncbi:hypothetical protein QQ045_013675 [Rhodiola kirilowii]
MADSGEIVRGGRDDGAGSGDRPTRVKNRTKGPADENKREQELSLATSGRLWEKVIPHEVKKSQRWRIKRILIPEKVVNFSNGLQRVK